MKTVVFLFFASIFSVLLLAACGNPVELSVTDISTLTLSYSDFSGSLDPAEVQKISPKGTLVRLAAGRDVEYAIAPQTDGITVDPHGVVLVDADAPVNPGGTEYTVTATGAGAYVNTQTATVTIKVVVPSGPTLDGTVAYDSIGTVFGTQAVGSAPDASSLTGSDGSVLLPPLRYTASDGSKELAPGITIAEATGIVTVAGTIDARTETHYTIMVSADGYQPVMLNGAVSITVDQLALQDLDYAIVTGVENTPITSTPPTIEPAGAIVKYSLSPGTQLPAGLDIDEDTGAIYGQTSSPVPSGTYSVTAAAADKNHTGSLTADVQVIVYSSTTPTITGTLTYSPISTTYGQGPVSAGIQSSTLASSRGSTNPLSSIQYTATDGTAQLAPGVTIDANSGEITVNSIAANAMTTSKYDVRITADNHQAATISNAVSVTVNQQDLTAISVFVQNPSSSETVTALTNDTTHSIASLLSGSYTAGTDYTLSIAPAPSNQNTTGAITIDSATGEISIDQGVTVADAGDYTITATGINNYINASLTTATFTLTVDPKDFTTAKVLDSSQSYGKTVTALTMARKRIVLLNTNTYEVGTDYKLSIAADDPQKQNTTGAITIDSAAHEIHIGSGVTVDDAGGYTITATGINNYTGTSLTTARFTLGVTPKDFKAANVFQTLSSSKTVDVFTPDTNSIALLTNTYTAGTDYTLSIAPAQSTQNTTGAITIAPDTGVISIDSGVTVADAGSYTITATGINNYINPSSTTATFTLTVDPKSFTAASVFVQNPSSSKTVTALTNDTTHSIASLLSGSYTAGTDYRLSIAPAQPTQNTAGAITIAPDTGVISIGSGVTVTDAGDYTITATGINNYTGTSSITFTLTVGRKGFKNAPIFDTNSLSATVDSQTAASHSILLTGSGYTFGTDYTLSIAPAPSNQNTTGAITIDSTTGLINIDKKVAVTDAGDYTITATGINNYTGTSSITFTLTVGRKDFAAISVFVQNPSSSKTVDVFTSDTHSIALLLSGSYTAGTDYTLSIAPAPSNQNTTGAITIAPDTGVISIDSGVTVTDAGDYTITATGINNYKNASSTTATFTLTVKPKSFTAANVFTQNPLPDINAIALTQSKHPIALSTTYKVGTDYELSIMAPGAITIDSATREIVIGQGVTMPDAGDYTITATGINNYTGTSSITATFKLTVTPKDFNNAQIFNTNSLSATVDSQTATSHSILLTGSGYTFGTDYTLSIAPVKSTQNTTGAITINSATGEISIGSGVTVNDAGSYTITATGKNNYDGVSTATLEVFISLNTIVQLSVTDRTFTSSTTGHYADVTAGGLTAGTDYQLRIEPATDASIDNAGFISLTSPTGGASYTVIAEGINNYQGEIRDSFTLRESLSSAGFKLSMKDYTVFSGDMSLVPAVIDNQKSADYTLSLVDSGGIVNPAGISINAGGWISIPNSIDANDSGEYTVIAAGTGNYGGTVKATFNLTVSDSDFIYNDFFVIATATAHSGGGASWQTFNAPSMAITPSWKNSPSTPAGTVFSVPNPSDKPGWLYLDSQTGKLSGTPTAIGFGSFIIEASLSGAAETTTVNWFVGVQPTNKDELRTAVQVELARYKSMSPPVTEYQDLRAIDTSLMTDMSELFYVDKYNNPQSPLVDFNGDILSWDVSNVENMAGMFKDNDTFNQDLSKWNVSSVTNMQGMFHLASKFNQDISKWNVSNVTNMWEMFSSADNFNQDISKWNVSSVTNMRAMFLSADYFNQDISEWNVGRVTDMTAMFNAATSFNQDISEWNVGRVTTMGGMFNSATSFSQDLNAWNVDSSVSTSSMFYNSGVTQTPHWYSP